MFVSGAMRSPGLTPWVRRVSPLRGYVRFGRDAVPRAYALGQKSVAPSGLQTSGAMRSPGLTPWVMGMSPLRDYVPLSFSQCITCTPDSSLPLTDEKYSIDSDHNINTMQMLQAPDRAAL
jgi:hypothetical protein